MRNHNMTNNLNKQQEIDDQQTSLQQTKLYAEYSTSSNSNNPNNIITDKLTINNYNTNLQLPKQLQLSYSQVLKQNTNLDMMILEEEIREDYKSN